jgi:hypothetical protein
MTGMPKELFMAAHEQLIEEYLADHPDADWSEAYERTADAADGRCRDKLADQIDSARLRAKEGR